MIIIDEIDTEVIVEPTEAARRPGKNKPRSEAEAREELRRQLRREAERRRRSEAD